MPDGLAPLAAPRAPVLGVARSAAGRIWRARDAVPGADRHALAIAQTLSLGELTGRLLAARGIDASRAAGFLTPTLRADLPDPSILRDMDQAAARLAGAVEAGETVGIFGDYDVDGAASAALVAGLLETLGCQVLTHIPDRLAEGYGPNVASLERMIEAGATLVLCVDCGTAAPEILEPLASRVAIVVLDHHKTTAVPRGLVACVNPNRPDDTSGLGQLCAAAVTFLALVATLRTLRRTGRFDVRPEPDLRRELDLVALATVCDMVPLTGVNRALVTQGLRVMAARERPGLAALLDHAGIQAAPDARTCGYALGPRINAGGRLGDCGLGLALLRARDRAEADPIAASLDAVNRERREVEGAMLDRAMDAAHAQVDAGHAVILLDDSEWHPGVVGIVAARIMRAINRPACVGARGASLVKGSGRSIPGLDLGAAIIAAREAGLLETGGGHAMAAGYGVRPERTADLHAFLDARLAAALTHPRSEDLAIDATIGVAAAGLPAALEIARLAPFGAGHPEPCLALVRVRIARLDRLGAERRTLRAILTDETARPRLKALRFGCDPADPVAALLEAAAGRLLHIAGTLRAERWNGEETASFAIEDAAYAEN